MYIVKKHSKSFSQPDGRALDGHRIGGTHGQVFESAQVLLLKESGGAQETKDHPLDFTVEAVYGFSFRSDVFREKLRNKIEPKALRVTAKTVDRSRDLIWFRVELPNGAGTYGGHPSQMQAIRLSEFEAWLTKNEP